MIESELSNEIVVGALVIVISWLWPYVIDLLCPPDTPSSTKRMYSKIYSYIVGPGAVALITFLNDQPAGSDVDVWVERIAIVLATVFGAQSFTHVGHKMSKETPLREQAKVSLVKERARSIEDLAPGDPIPRRLRKQAEAEKVAAEQAQFAEWKAWQEATGGPPPAPAQPAVAETELLERARAAQIPLAPPE